MIRYLAMSELSVVLHELQGSMHVHDLDGNTHVVYISYVYIYMHMHMCTLHARTHL